MRFTLAGSEAADVRCSRGHGEDRRLCSSGADVAIADVDDAPSLARAVEDSGIEHVVFMSSVGAHRPSATGLIQSLYYAEQRFADVKADITFSRA